MIGFEKELYLIAFFIRIPHLKALFLCVFWDILVKIFHRALFCNMKDNFDNKKIGKKYSEIGELF